MLPRRPSVPFSFTSLEDRTYVRKSVAAAKAESLHCQIDTAWLLLRTAKRFPPYEGSHQRLVKASARVLRRAEAQMWRVELEPADLVQLASSVEGLWFAIDALS